MIRLVYLSVATKEMSNDDLLFLLEQSREKNKKVQITGMLLYGGGNFLQMLEGDEKEVRNLYEKILLDERHKDCFLIEEIKISERTFGAWSMGFKHLNPQEAAEIEGFSHFLERKVAPDTFARKRDAILDLLYEFKRNF
jgi:hypothetical protein